MDFGRHSLIHFWKDLYTTTCPICLDDSVLYSEGIVLPFCQHYSCRDCFGMYLKYKVKDLKEYRTNPFVCPVETCKRELPILGYCKQYLSPEDMDAVRAWYHDLKHPPCWSLDRCLAIKTCGALGSMRRRKGSIATTTTTTSGGNNKKGQTKSQTTPSYDSHLVYCEECQKTWCELCLKRVYDEGSCTNKSRPTNLMTMKVKSGRHRPIIGGIVNLMLHLNFVVDICVQQKKSKPSVKNDIRGLKVTACFVNTMELPYNIF